MTFFFFPSISFTDSQSFSVHTTSAASLQRDIPECNVPAEGILCTFHLSSSLCSWKLQGDVIFIKSHFIFSGLHQRTPSVAVAVQLQNPKTLLLWETDPPEGKTGSSATQHCTTTQQFLHDTSATCNNRNTAVFFDMFLPIAACRWIIHLTSSWGWGLHADHSYNWTERKLPWPASLGPLP